MYEKHDIAVLNWSRHANHSAPVHIPPRKVCVEARVKYWNTSQERAEFMKTLPGSRMNAAMAWDMSSEGQAHKWTIREALLTQEFIPTPPGELNSEDTSCELNLLVTLMWHLGYGLVNHSHLSKHDLYCRLYYKILDEPCLLIFGAHCREMIDCLHPMDLYEGSTALERVHSRDERPEVYGDVWGKMPLAPESEGEHGVWFLQPGDRIVG
jgi:hypothetical protein